MKLRRLLSALPWVDLPNQIARDLKRLEIHDGADIAIVEWSLVGGFDDYELFNEWLANWPPPDGVPKARCDKAKFESKLSRLAKAGAISRGAELAPGEALEGILPGYPRRNVEAAGHVTVDLDTLVDALGTTASKRTSRAGSFLKGQGAGGLHLKSTDIEGLGDEAAAIASSLLAAVAECPELESEFMSAVQRLAADLPASKPERTAALALICGFSTEIATWFEPDWLLVSDGVENRPRREHFARVWLHYAGIRFLTSGKEESALARGIRLIDGDPRREARWTEERAMQDRLVDEAQRRIDAEVARREQQKKAYASGRRE